MSLTRLTSTRVAARAFVRMYSEKTTTAGSVSGTKAFGEKEKAQENRYVHEKEQAQLKKMREALNASKAELAEMEKRLDEAEKSKK